MIFFAALCLSASAAPDAAPAEVALSPAIAPWGPFGFSSESSERRRVREAGPFAAILLANAVIDPHGCGVHNLAVLGVAIASGPFQGEAAVLMDPPDGSRDWKLSGAQDERFAACVQLLPPSCDDETITYTALTLIPPDADASGILARLPCPSIPDPAP